MSEQKLTGMLGLAARAGQIAAGMDACRIMIRNGKCGILLLDAEAGPNTRKKAEDLCRKAGTPLAELPAGLISRATGKDNMVIAIRQGSFSEQFLQTDQG